MSGGALVTVPDVPMPAVAEPDPRLFEIVPFIGYDDAGRFTDEGKMGIAILEQKVAAGQQILINVLVDRHTEWFDGTEVQPRPVLDLPASLEVEVGVEAVVPRLPACTVRVRGPYSVEFEHPGGDLEVGFTVPGTYTITGEPFPARPFTLTLTVSA